MRKLFFLAVAMFASLLVAQEAVFEKEFKQEVPARGFGAKPRRTLEQGWQIPAEFVVKREENQGQHGVVVVEKHLERMTERRLEFSLLDNGIRIVWELENPERFPATGREGRLKLKLVGIRKDIPKIEFSARYQKIRQKFFEQFYFHGLVAEYVSSDEVKFADCTIYMGHALIFLASEVKLKRQRGEDPGESLAKIREILDMIETLDREAEPLFGAESRLDGFFIRDNIREEHYPGHSKKFVSDAQNPSSASPSGDQIFGLLMGLWAVVHLTEDSASIQRAKEISDRIYRYAQRCNFILTLPNGEENKRGSDVRWLSSLLHGLNKDITGIDRFSKSKIEVLGIAIPLNSVASFWNDAGNNVSQWCNREVEIPGLGKKAINSFAIHILLMAVSISDLWSEQVFENTAIQTNHQLSALLRALAHNRLPLSFGYRDIQSILDKCPENGPSGNNSPETTWHKDSRWIRCKDLQDQGSPGLDYNGVDFLMLHNLMLLVFGRK